MRSKLFYFIMIGLIAMISACAGSGDKWKQDTADNSNNKEDSWQKNRASTGSQNDATSNPDWSRGSRY